MSSGSTYMFWSMTINNYTETDLALLAQGYPDHLRQLVYTREVGEKEGTPHIQAYMKLNRPQRLSYVTKLFPRGRFQSISTDEYNLNSQRYAQKLDETADSPAFITNNPFPDPVVELVSVIEDVMKNFMYNEEPSKYRETMFLTSVKHVESIRVAEKPSLAKFYVSSTYKTIKSEFWRSIVQHLVDAEHTRTHTQAKIKSKQNGINATPSRSSSPRPSQDEHHSRATSRRSSWGTSVSSQGV